MGGKKEHVCNSTCSWMKDFIPKGIGQKSLLDIMIPGTHDSATNEITSSSLYAAGDGEEAFSSVPSILKNDITKLVSKRYAVKWAVNQRKSITKQLQHGIRYLDLRVCGEKEKKKDIKQIYTCHFFVGSKIENVLNQVDSFTKTHKKEIIILDFQHFYSMGDDEHEYLANLIKDTFGNRLVPNNFVLTDNIQTIWDNNWSIIVFYNKTKKTTNFKRKKYEFLWKRDSKYIVSKYLEAEKSKILHSKLDKHLQHRFKVLNGEEEDEIAYDKILHVSQGVITPDVNRVMTGVKGRDIEAVGEKITKYVIDWILKEWIDLNLNVVIVDQYHKTKFIEEVLKINQKRLQS